MQRIQYSILRYLDERREWRTASVLSAHFSVSVRKIKYIISELNKEETLIISSKLGYITNPDKKEQISKLLREQANIDDNFDDYETREKYILRKLLHESVDMYELSEELFLNITTLRQEITKIKQKLAQYNLQLHSKNNIYYVSGNEKDKRKIMSMILSQEAKKGFVLENIVGGLCSKDDISYIQQILRENMEELQVYYNDYSLMNLVIHLIIIIDRNEKGFSLTNIGRERGSFVCGINEAARKTFTDIETYFGVKFEEEEIYDFSLLMESQTQLIELSNLTEINLDNFVDSDVSDLVMEIIDKVRKEYYLDLSENSFLVKFALHIKNLLLRIQIDRFSKNPYVDYIKSACPSIYEVSVYIANIIYQKTGILINDNEIAFLALHISSVYDNSIYSEKTKAILLCPDYYDIVKNNIKKIETKCSDELYIYAIANNETELQKRLEDCELILSTIELKEHYPQEVVYFSPLLTDKELSLIKDAVSRVHSSKEYQEVNAMFSALFSPELFFYQKNGGAYKDVISLMCERMKDTGYVDDTYYEKVIERERISSTVYGKIAIPHALKASALRSGICILISDKQIKWKSKGVNVVFLIAIHPDEQLLFTDIFNKISEVLMDDDTISRIVKCKTYEEVLSFFIR